MEQRILEIRQVPHFHLLILRRYLWAKECGSCESKTGAVGLGRGGQKKKEGKNGKERFLTEVTHSLLAAMAAATNLL